MKILALVAKKGKSEAVALARQIKERYPDKTLLAERHLAEALGWPPVENERDLAAQAELVIVLGGDGTLIHAARIVAGRNIPILGVNLGSLGFLTEFPQAELFPALEQVFAGKLKGDSRMKLACKLWRGNKLVAEDEVLNDVVINKGALARIAAHEALVDGEYVTTYYSDGVVVATPTGSTAYSLSAGGPIIHPSLDCMVLSPISSHALTQRPILIPPDRTVSIVLSSEIADVYLTLDGQAGHALRSGDRVEIQRAAHRAQLLRNPRLGYYGILRQKLHWGER